MSERAPLLQDRYPIPASEPGGETLYKLRSHLTAEERAWNVEQLRNTACSRQAHADALKAEGNTAHDDATLSAFDPDPAMDAAIEAKIEAKIEAALDAGVGPAVPGELDDASCRAVLDNVDLTDEERDYVARQGLVKVVRVEVGRKVVETLNAGNLRLGREDLISSLGAYFDAVAAGEVEAS